MANSADPDETAHDEPSHQDLHCLPEKLFWHARRKGLKFSVQIVSENIYLLYTVFL